MSAPVKLVSVNIEMHRHLDSVLSFLKAEQSDIICLQEVFERDVPRFERELGFGGRFEPMATLESPSFEDAVRGLPFGLAIFSRFPAEYHTDYYVRDSSRLPRCVKGDEDNRLVLSAAFLARSGVYRVGTTHFTWTPDGKPNDAQRRDMDGLLEILNAFPDLVLCGDFNAPRTGEIWTRITGRYNDHIPEEYDSSLDPKLHRAGELTYVVDGLFSTPHYRVTDVRLVEGVSDHKAVVGYISKL